MSTASTSPSRAGPARSASTSAPSAAPHAPAATVPAATTAPAHDPSTSPAVERVLAALGQMAEDVSLPRNIRRGAQGAREALLKTGVEVDLRVAGAVGLLDDLANDSNLPVHGRTAIWSLISQLESLQ